jgi:hypothetical protein
MNDSGMAPFGFSLCNTYIIGISYNRPVGGEMASTGTRKLRMACRGHRVHDKKR